MLNELTVEESRLHESDDGHHKGNGDCCRQHPINVNKRAVARAKLERTMLSITYKVRKTNL